MSHLEVPLSPAAGLVRVAQVRYSLAVQAWTEARADLEASRSHQDPTWRLSAADREQIAHAEREADEAMSDAFVRLARVKAQARAAGAIG